MRAVLIPADDPRVRGYELRNQEVIDRARLRRLRPLVDLGAHRIAGALSADLHQPVHITVTGFEQVIWDEQRAVMEDPTFVAGAAMVGLEGRLVVHVPAELALALVEVLLGGTGDEQPDRLELTDLEHSLMSSLTDGMFAAVQSAVETLVDLRITTLQKLRSSIYLKMGRPGETCLKIDLEVTIADRRTRAMYLYWPLGVLGPMLEALDRIEVEDDVDASRRWASAERRLLGVPIELQVSYPRVRLTTTEVVGLCVGDVIPLRIDRDDDQPHLDVIAGGQCIGKAVPVVQNKRIACTIASWREERT